MLRTLTRASAAAVLMAWAMPAAALECSDYAELLDSNVARPVLQSIVLESPPEDGWSCLTATRHSVSDLRMARAFGRLDSTQSLAWTMRFRQCEAGQGLRRGTRRLFADEEAPPPEPVRPETEACKRAAALQHAIAADEEA